MAASCGPGTKARVESVVAVTESLSLDSMHCLSLGVVFLIVGPPQTSYFVVDNCISFKDRQEDVIDHYVRCKQSSECLIVDNQS